jgi:hypothetical protein
MTSIGFPQPFGKDVSSIIASFIASKQYKFLHWIKPDLLDWTILSAWIDESILKRNPKEIDWFVLSQNPNAPFLVDTLYKNLDILETKKKPESILHIANFSKVDDVIDTYFWKGLNTNSSLYAIRILLKNPDKINWKLLSSNSHPIAIALLERNITRIDFAQLCSNSGAVAMIEKRGGLKLLTNSYDTVKYWYYFSANPSAMHIIKEYPKFINWPRLTTNPAAIDMIMSTENVDTYWDLLCHNPAAISFLEKTDRYISSYQLSFNKAIIEPDNQMYNVIKSAWTKFIYCLTAQSPS